MQSLEERMESWSTASKKGPTARPLSLEGLSRDYCNKEVNDDLWSGQGSGASLKGRGLK